MCFKSEDISYGFNEPRYYQEVLSINEFPFIPDNGDNSIHATKFLDGFTFPKIHVITNEDPEAIKRYNWGLIPFWNKTAIDAKKFRTPGTKGINTLNAKIETITELASYRVPVKSKRCFILKNGFFEWQHLENKTKIPYYIFNEEGEPLLMAGVYDFWTDKETGEVKETCSIITKPANLLMSKIHNSKKRMPALLTPDQAKLWISNDIPLDNQIEMITNSDDVGLAAHTISKRITERDPSKTIDEIKEPYDWSKVIPDFTPVTSIF